MCLSKEEGDLQIFVKYQNHSKSPLILCFLIRSLLRQLCEWILSHICLQGKFFEHKYSFLKETASVVFKLQIQKAFFTHLKSFSSGLFCCICTLEYRRRHVQPPLKFYFSSQTLNNEKLGSDELRYRH